MQLIDVGEFKQKSPLAETGEGRFSIETSPGEGNLEPDFHLTSDKPALIDVWMGVRYRAAYRRAF